MENDTFHYYCKSPTKAHIVLPDIPNKTDVILNGKHIKIADIPTDMDQHIIDVESGEYYLEI
jgi:hypothetical protein